MPRAPLKGDTRNLFTVAAELSFTHVRLNIFPDGGVARLRVPGEVVPDPRLAGRRAARPRRAGQRRRGGRLLEPFYSSPNNLLLPGRARVMGEGWETARRRDDAGDWVEVRLAAQGVVWQVEIPPELVQPAAGRPARGHP